MMSRFFTRKRAALQTVLVLLLLTTAWGAVGASAAPLRVLVQPPRSGLHWYDLRERGICVDLCVALYLQDWLGHPTAGVQLVDEAQATAVMGVVLSPASSLPAEDALAAVRVSTEVDALLRWRWNAGALSVTLHRPNGVQTREIPWRDVPATPGALKALTDWLAPELGANPQASPFARGLATDNPALLDAYYLAQRFRADWIDNTGASQLDMLRPYLTRLPKDTWVAAAMVRAGAAMSVDSRVVPKPITYMMMLQQALPGLLGTEFEPDARHLCEVNRLLPEVLEKELLAMVKSIGLDEVETDLGAETPAGDPAAEKPGNGVLVTLGGKRSVAQQAGALRCLGLMKSQAALPCLARGAKAREVPLRRAAAWALAAYVAPAGAAELAHLQQDPDAPTAFLAAWALWRRGQAPADLASRAVACLAVEPGCAEALDALAAKGTKAEAPRLLAGLAAADSAVRARVASAGLRLGVLEAATVQSLLADPNGAVVRAAVAGLADDALPQYCERLMELANHPDASLAESARRRLTALMPAEPRARRLFELSVEHPYVRRQLVDALAKDASPEALADLEIATANADAHTRAHALLRLSEKAPDRARTAALRLVTEPHRWVRLQAAAVAAQVAAPADLAVLEKALGAEKDEATRLYLQDAVARAAGKPTPAPRPAANRVTADKTLPFLCNHGADAARSPIQGYYDLAYMPDAPARQAQAAGKVFLVRANKTAGNPADVFLNLKWQDGFWLGMDAEFGDLAALDGIVLGEESMYFRQWNQWDNGWRLFCREAGLDPQRVAGDKEKLSVAEKQAWWSWEQRVAIEGFNVMHDWIKLCYGKRRPGFQVATFLPDQNGPCEFDREWKFDIGAGYCYETNNRHRFTQIRRFKTLWPDRPVLWLCEADPNSKQPLNYTTKPLTSPLPSARMPPYADALCAWMAGATPGYFYAKLATDKDTKPGPSAGGIWVMLEDLWPGCPTLTRASDNMFRGVAGLYRTLAATKAVQAQQAAGNENAGAADQELPELDEADATKDPCTLRVKAESDAATLGLLLEKQLVWNCARLLTGLPQVTVRNEVLLVGDQHAQAGALRLPQAYDFLDGVNTLAGADLTRYRLIAIADAEKSLLRDATITALSAWLRDTPGLLYVNGWLSTDNAAESATVTDRDARLQTDWPWEKDVTRTEKAYGVTGGQAKFLTVGGTTNSLVFWQGAGCKGGVLFDQSDLAPEALREVINKLVAEKKLGVPLAGPIGMERLAFLGGTATTTCSKGASADLTVPGLELLSGVMNPVLGKARAGAFVATEYRGPYTAVHGGVGVLCDQPLTAVAPLADGLEIDCGGGLVQAVSVTGTVAVKAGAELPIIAPDKLLAWVLTSNAPGLAQVTAVAPGTGMITFIRTPGKVTLRQRAAAP